MAPSSQKFIAANRAPRVQIEYDVELYGAGQEVVHRLERDRDGQLAGVGQRVGHPEGDAWLHRLHHGVEVVDVDRKELAIGDGR